MRRRLAAPQLAKLVEAPPEGNSWVHEPKYDGYRILAYKSGRSVQLLTRNNKDYTSHFPAIKAALERLPVRSFILDGELVCVDSSGHMRFQSLQQAFKLHSSAGLEYIVFDLLELNGTDLRRVPLLERQAVLRKIVPNGRLVHRSTQVSARNRALLTWAAKHGYEGIVSKRKDAPYTPGRSSLWLKSKSSNREEFVIVGFKPHSKIASQIGALLIGLFEGSAIVPCGKVGTGFDTASRSELFRKLSRIAVERLPFMVPPVRGMTLVRPKYVAEVGFTEWTEDGKLRHPVFSGLRIDKPAAAVQIECSSHPAAKIFSGDDSES